jgi:hypothetical protein
MQADLLRAAERKADQERGRREEADRRRRRLIRFARRIGAVLVSILVVVAVVAMAVEMAAGFAAATAIFRARDVDMTDMAADLKR